MAQAQVDMSLKGSVKSSKPSLKQERSKCVKQLSLPRPPPPTIREPKQMKRSKSTVSYFGGFGKTHLNIRNRKSEVRGDVPDNSSPYVGVAVPLDMIYSLSEGISQLANYCSYNQQRQQ
ncbi:unnamed protein product [Allacma fusca]|uniref:Uncharacterized protein n=1 Tax=Allacma fusca TaxID=39272 RepID=A0A8J2NSK6_9HEXA|nr:unnamed protein product [Allacma fusca]